jgi:hypothetical protein
MDLRWEEHVNVAFSSECFGGAGMLPDPLPLIRNTVEMKANENRAIGLSVHAKSALPAGEYRT